MVFSRERMQKRFDSIQVKVRINQTVKFLNLALLGTVTLLFKACKTKQIDSKLQ